MAESRWDLRTFLAELKRRRVFRVAVVYAVVAFVIWQAAEIAVPGLHLPDWVLTLVILLTVLGFPIALVLAWALEITPEGIRRNPALEPGVGPPGEEAAEPAATAAEPQPASIAVLPFTDMSPEKDQEYFCDGMAEELINALTKVKELRVAARTSSFQFKGKSEDVCEIAKKLRVGSVLEGSVRRAGDRLRVTAQLVSAEDGYHLWSETYERQLEDVFAIQDEISRSIVDTLRLTLLGEEGPRLVRASTRSPEAYDWYLRGRYYWDQRYEVGLETALKYFQQAVEIDPEYALAYRGIADCYTILGIFGYLPPNEAMPKAMGAALRALELDDGLSEAHASLGFVHFWNGWDWEIAEKEYARAIELNPNNAEVRAWYAVLCDAQGRFEEALEHAVTARRLDPLHPFVALQLGNVKVLTGDFENAIRHYEEVVEREPEYLLAVFLLSYAYSLAGRHDDAVRMGERALTLAKQAPFFKGALAGRYGRAGREDEARSILAELSERTTSEYISPLFLLWSYLGLKDEEKALEYLAKAVAEQSPYLALIHGDPQYDFLRSDPRFIELASQVGSGVVKSASAGRETHE
jgi:TolB-like protein/Flp pilus assembly protein TadD